jgi:ribonucleoside-diphosphate reductase beta chain
MPLRTELQPYRDYQLAKRFAWDPAALDFAQDQKDWATLAPREQDLLRNLFSLFIAGEEAVATDLAPLLWALGRVGGLREEEMFVTTQLFDESRHVEFFHRWFDLTGAVEHSQYWGPAYRAVFFEEQPQALRALVHDQSPEAFIRAYTVYHVIVEGMLAETGYHGAFLACERRGVLPALRQGIEYIKRDESRHIAYGLYALERLLSARPDLWDFTNARLNELLQLALGVIPEALERYGADVPFGIDLMEMTQYAIDQFNKRYEKLEAVVRS